MATTMDGTICISGKTMPTLAENGLTVTKEKIWSANTNRTATGHMVGDIIAIKYKLQCKWNHLMMEQVAAIDSAVSGAAFFTVTFTDPATNQPTENIAYVRRHTVLSGISIQRRCAGLCQCFRRLH